MAELSLDGALADGRHVMQVRVYYEDTDFSGFVYHATINGTTGAARCAPAEVSAALARVRGRTKLPVAAGFGIREPAQARDLAGQADLVVVGSQLVQRLEQDGVDAALEAVRGFAQAVRAKPHQRPGSSLDRVTPA